MRKAIVTFVQKTEADKEGPKELWYSEIDGVFVRNSLSYEKEAQQRKVDGYLNKISKNRDREILKAYFGIERNYALCGEELSKEFGLSPVRISQIVHKTLKELRK